MIHLILCATDAPRADGMWGWPVAVALVVGGIFYAASRLRGSK